MYLYLTEQGSSVSIDGGKILVESENLRHEIPKNLLDSVIVFGNIHLTTAFMRFCLKKEIPVSFFSNQGLYFGRLISTTSSNIHRLKKQIYASEDKDFALSLSFLFVEAKINNQVTVVRRYKKYSPQNLDPIIDQMLRTKAQLSQCKSHQELMGKEGYCARLYFHCLASIVPEDFHFKGRSKRPPKDPFNSLISLGYTLLLHEIVGILEHHNLSPYAGFLHQDSDKSPTLASDLIEEWRAPIVDSLVLSMIMNGKFTLDDFMTYEDRPGVFLTQEALKSFLAAITQKMDARMNYLAYLKEPVSFRKGIFHQAQQLVTAIELDSPHNYSALRIR